MDDLGRWVSLLAAGAASCALFMLLHAFRWERVFGAKPRVPGSYVAGIIGLAIPFTALMALWGDWWAVAGAASVVVGGGAAVLYGYYIRGIARRDEPPQDLAANEYEAIIKVLRRQNTALERELMRVKGERNAKREQDAA